MQPADMQEKYDSITFHNPTPEGEATVIVVESQPGVIYKIFFTIGKAGSGVNAWAFALAEMVVFALQQKADLNDVIISLSNITSSRYINDGSGIPCRSGPEALYLSLMKYRNLYKGSNSSVKYDETFKASRMKT